MKKTTGPAARLLLTFLRSSLAVAVLPEHPGMSFTQGDQRFTESGHGDLTGFYDWLRDASGTLLGVRYWPLREVDFPRDAVRHLPYVAVSDEDPSIEIYFSTRRDFEPGLSVDQDFGENTVYVSDDGDYAVSFGTHWLEEADLHRIRSYGVDWVTVR